MSFTAVDTKVANMAIRNLGEGAEIQNLATDDSEEGQACRVYFEQARDETLEIFDWNFARKFATALGLVSSDPTAWWRYAYRVPPDCVAFRSIPNGRARSARDEEIDFETVPDAQGMLVYTNQADAGGKYTFRQTNLGFWSSTAKTLLSFRLAYYIAPSISEKEEKSVEMLAKFRALQPDALAVSGSQKRFAEPPLPKTIRARNG